MSGPANGYQWPPIVAHTPIDLVRKLHSIIEILLDSPGQE
jgi:hypothetical protein